VQLPSADPRPAVDQSWRVLFTPSGDRYARVARSGGEAFGGHLQGGVEQCWAAQEVAIVTTRGSLPSISRPSPRYQSQPLPTAGVEPVVAGLHELELSSAREDYRASAANASATTEYAVGPTHPPTPLIGI
jgi:hypothetical protein